MPLTNRKSPDFPAKKRICLALLCVVLPTLLCAYLHTVPVYELHAQAINYFLEPTRLQNTSYFWRFLDIIKSSTGKPLLEHLSKQTVKLVSHLDLSALT